MLQLLHYNYYTTTNTTTTTTTTATQLLLLLLPPTLPPLSRLLQSQCHSHVDSRNESRQSWVDRYMENGLVDPVMMLL